MILLIVVCATHASATEFEAPPVPYSAEQYFPEDAETFEEGLFYILKNALAQLQPALSAALKACARILAVTILVAIPETLQGNRWYTELVGVLLTAFMLMGTSEDMITQAISAVNALCEYGKP